MVKTSGSLISLMFYLVIGYALAVFFFGYPGDLREIPWWDIKLWIWVLAFPTIIMLTLGAIVATGFGLWMCIAALLDWRNARKRRAKFGSRTIR